VPFPVRVAVARWRCLGAWHREAGAFQFELGSRDRYPYKLAEHCSPLRRPGTTYAEDMQRGKETNVAQAAKLIDGIVVPPGAVFSYHHAVGPPSRKRGFVMGAELQDSSLKPGIGGGCCQISNLLYVLALLSGAEITERHRHGLDLFPDSGRTVPFGCGATVFFPMRDLKFRNALDQEIMISLNIEDGFVVGRVHTAKPESRRFEIFEMESDISKQGEVWIRTNKVGRRSLDCEGQATVETVAENIATCAYDPTAVGQA